MFNQEKIRFRENTVVFKYLKRFHVEYGLNYSACPEKYN